MSALWRTGLTLVLCLLTLYTSIGGASSEEFVSKAGFKGGLLWNKFNKIATNTCASTGGVRLLNLLNLVCSTAQAQNTTARDGCYGCFIRYTSLPQGQQQLLALSSCATMYFANTSYAACANRLAVVSGTQQVLIPTNGDCTSGFCDFVRCLRRANSNNIIIQCSREVRAAGVVNVALDNDNVRYYTNMTSCILAKARCNTYNPITGELQLPGITTVNSGKVTSQVKLYNSLQTAPDGTLRIVSFPASIGVSTTYCSNDASLANANWLDNECP